MNSFCSLALLGALVFLGPIFANAEARLAQMPLAKGLLQVHVGEYREHDEPAADILYFHGYGDRFSNHTALFSEWTRMGFRIIAFDLPSHGQTRTSVHDLDDLSFADLARIAGAVERAHVENPNRPLILAGWSLGGLIATRMVQAESLATLSRRPSGLVLMTPGVSVYKCVGNWACRITNETLTHDSSLFTREIKPGSPLSRLGFAAHLLTNASLAWHQAVPANVPTFVVVGGLKEDLYVKSRDLMTWVRKKREEGSNVQALHCPNARHEVDNELPQYGGAQVRAASARFLKSIITAGHTDAVDGPCRSF